MEQREDRGGAPSVSADAPIRVGRQDPTHEVTPSIRRCASRMRTGGEEDLLEHPRDQLSLAPGPPWRELPGGYRVVTRERLGRELIGAVGPRADLFALYEKAEEAASPG